MQLMRKQSRYNASKVTTANFQLKSLLQEQALLTLLCKCEQKNSFALKHHRFAL